MPLAEPRSSSASTAIAPTVAHTSRPVPDSSTPVSVFRPRSEGAISRAAAATKITAPRNTQRQPTASATNAASAGPNSAGSTHAAAKLAKMLGCRTAGKTRPTRT